MPGSGGGAGMTKPVYPPSANGAGDFSMAGGKPSGWGISQGREVGRGTYEMENGGKINYSGDGQAAVYLSPDGKLFVTDSGGINWKMRPEGSKSYRDIIKVFD